MAEIANIKPWETVSAGEKLFLLVYDLIAPTVPDLEYDSGWSYSSLGLSEFFRLTLVMEVIHRCMNVAVPLVEINRDITAAAVENELRNTLQVRMAKGSVTKLAEITRLSAIAYVYRKLPDGLANRIHETSKPSCCWCGKSTSRSASTIPADKATVEHIWPEFLGGESVQENLIIACGACNSARKHAFTWAWFGVQACNEQLDKNKSIPKELKLSVGLHRLMKVASGQTIYSNEIISLKEAAIRLRSVIPKLELEEETRYTFLEILNNAKE